MYKKYAAFSLLEVLVVVVVIGILAAMVIPKLANAKGKTSIASAAEDLEGIAQVLSHYQAVHGTFPPNASRAKDAVMLKPYFKDFTPFQTRTPIGGVYDYIGLTGSNPVSIAIVNELQNEFSRAQAQELDDYMDDGKLSGGRIKLVNGQLQYRFADTTSVVEDD